MKDKESQQYDNNKLLKKLRHAIGEAINDYQMIEENDVLMVCVSGGKDSYALLDLLLGLQKTAPIAFKVVAVHLDQGQPGFDSMPLEDYLKKNHVPHHIIRHDTYSIVKSKISSGKTKCSLCSRLRRGILYRIADEIGATKIALGHHRDDILETFFLNLFYGGKLKAMPPKLVSDNRKHIVIRPLAYVPEDRIIRLSELRAYPVLPCTLCGSQPNLQRQVMKEMLKSWQKKYPGRVQSIFSALQDIVPSHLLDRRLYDFKSVSHNPDRKIFDINILSSSPNYSETSESPTSIWGVKGN